MSPMPDDLYRAWVNTRLRRTLVSTTDVAMGRAKLCHVDDQYPLTWSEALRAAKDGAVIECSACNPEYGNITAIYDDARHVLVDWIWTDWVLTPDAADIAAPWRIVSPDSEEVQP